MIAETLLPSFLIWCGQQRVSAQDEKVLSVPDTAAKRALLALADEQASMPLPSHR